MPRTGALHVNALTLHAMMLVAAVVCACVCAAATADADANPFVHVDTDSHFFVDSDGRVRIFHGVNAVYKEAPWHPQLEGFDTQNSLSDVDAQNLNEWGMNVVRLGVEWPGVEPEQGQYNDTYLDAIGEIVETLGRRGIYTILDCHQDIFSRYYCGEGVPDWATPLHASLLPFPLPAVKERLPTQNGTDYPDINACLEHTFSRYYFSGAVSASFQALYDNRNGLQDHFTDYWRAVASRFSNSSYVLGYELINEPWCGDLYKQPSLLLKPGLADTQNLAPMYEHLNDAIREIDNEHVIFFEPAVSDLFHSGFEQGPGGPEYNDRNAYSYHIYCYAGSPDGDPNNVRLCNITDTIMYQERVDDYHRMGVGGFMTEFGAMLGTENGVESLHFVTGQADKYIQSWAYWSFKYYQDITTVSTSGGESFYLKNGTLDEPKVRALSRSYAQVIAGVPSLHMFDPDTAEFTLTYTINEEAKVQSTEVYVNERFYYPTGLDVAVEPPASASFTHAHNRVTVVHAPGASGDLTVTIRPRSGAP
eukprot:TRINITY_DN6604_c0_g2_i1.p1 TRINITY_DN6604_c0_g2~~TRINITY_DN6604_c0_g2_i1.p1  ORF type:complete len:554 (+),score=159.76 TRINITY_DN6604_c0_g2_i1:65-1663(+)